MVDPSNPSISEIKEWAYSDNEWPDSEWDLFLSWKQDVKLFIELASDHKCPKQAFFLHMLYYLVGVAVQERLAAEKEFTIKGYLNQAEGVKHGDVKAWVVATERLLNDPESYKFEDWRGGKLTNYKFI